MENYKSIEKRCFIGETKCKAGIFLSEEIARGKPFYKWLKWERYPDFQAAEMEFFNRYEKEVSKKDFRLNHLFDVRESPRYSVFWTSYCVGVTYTEYFGENIEKILPNCNCFIWQRHGLEYEDAMRYALNIIEKNSRFQSKRIITGLKIHEPFYFCESI